MTFSGLNQPPIFYSVVTDALQKHKDVLATSLQPVEKQEESPEEFSKVE